MSSLNWSVLINIPLGKRKYKGVAEWYSGKKSYICHVLFSFLLTDRTILIFFYCF